MVRLIEMNGSPSGRPKKNIVITKCGLLKEGQEDKEEKKPEEEKVKK